MSGGIQLNREQEAMLHGERGPAKQMGMRLLMDMAATAAATELVSIDSAHLSGVSPLTGGLGLRQFLAKLTSDPDAAMAVPTSLNAAGCDQNQFESMRIVAPDFLEQSREIVELYERLGVQSTQSCVPYEWEGLIPTGGSGTAAWAESNAICFANSYCGFTTNRESGLSALAAALTGYTPKYGLLNDEARHPNLEVIVTASMLDPTDFSILGDWIGKQRRPGWRLPYGPIPHVKGLPANLDHEQKKALTAAAANYGCPMLYIDGLQTVPDGRYQDSLTFDDAALRRRYAELSPASPISLITLGCPQASIGELRAIAQHLKGKQVTSKPVPPGQAPPLWIFTSAAGKAIAEKTGLAQVIRQSGALLLENTCPEVVPYDQSWVKHILTNSMKAEHYIKSGLNGIPTSVMTLADCIATATGKHYVSVSVDSSSPATGKVKKRASSTAPVQAPPPASGSFSADGHGLPSQSDFTIRGTAFVTGAPITLLGFVNRQTGVIEEEGHPANGQSMAGKIAIFPKGSGSTVAPYVLLELFYRGMAPIAIVNTDIDQQTAPACSLEGIPYAYAFDADVIAQVNNGDQVELKRHGSQVTLTVLERKSA